MIRCCRLLIWYRLTQLVLGKLRCSLALYLLCAYILLQTYRLKGKHASKDAGESNRQECKQGIHAYVQTYKHIDNIDRTSTMKTNLSGGSFSILTTVCRGGSMMVEVLSALRIADFLSLFSLLDVSEFGTLLLLALDSCTAMVVRDARAPMMSA